MESIVKQQPLPLGSVRILGGFWAPYQRLMREVMLPYQWDALNDRVPGAEPSYAIRNLRIAAGLEQGEFQGFFFQDSDLAKWLEAVAYSLHTSPDPELEALADGAIALVAQAQQPDGYLNSYFTTAARGRRWTNLHECHELYVAGHFIEAGVAWFEATGKRNLLDVACRLADCIDGVFGPEDGKLRGYDGHEEIELALARLYDVTGERRYLRLSQFFLDERGREPYYFSAEWQRLGGVSAWTGAASEDPGKNRAYNQAHLPVREQRTAVGHAVRQLYLLTGMADMAGKTGDAGLLAACRALWRDIVDRQMYITGGVGASHHGEIFTFAYDLPNDTVYAETCASVGLILFAERMLRIENRREYADVIERALYNLIAGSVAADGMHYFYVNPLEVWPEASEKNPGRRHVKAVRQRWFGCACCPPNLARLLGSLGRYIYTACADTLYVHQYIGSEATVDVGGARFTLRQESDYPWRGDVLFTVSVRQDTEHTLALRVPGWCDHATVTVCGAPAEAALPDEDGYLRMRRVWRNGDTVTLSMDMPVERMRANPLVRACAGKVAIQRGPVVYCLEEADNGANLSALSLPEGAALEAAPDGALPGGAWSVRGTALRDGAWPGGLYRPAHPDAEPVPVRAVPYCLWGNREPGEMLVWMRAERGGELRQRAE